MTTQLACTLAILGGAIVLFLSDRVRPDLVALLVLVALGTSRVLTQQEALAGLSSAAVVTIMSVFILAEGLARTGVTDQAGALLLRVAGRRERSLTSLTMCFAAALSLFMNNIASASVLLPAVSGVARKARVSPSRLLMPLAFATILGGMATLLTSANIVVSGILQGQGLRGYGLLDFAPLGLPIVVVGIAYMVFWGRHMLPKHAPREPALEMRDEDLLNVYRLGERLFRARIPAGSKLVDKPLAQSTLREGYGLSVIAIERDGRVLLAPDSETCCHEGDVVLFKGNLEDFRARDTEPYLEILPPRDWHEGDLESPTVVMVEAMLTPRSSLIGRTAEDLRFRERYGMSVLAIWRGRQQIRVGVRLVPLAFGDALLLQGPRERLALLHDDQNLILLTQEERETPVVRSRGRLAVGIMAATLVLAALHQHQLAEIMLGGALMMLVAGLLTMEQAYQAIDWKSIFVVAGMLPMGTAMLKSGAAGLVAGSFLNLIGTSYPLLLVAALFILTTLLTQAMTGAAVAAVMAPVAIQASHVSGLDPRSVCMAVALGTSMAFLTPLGHPVNLLVMGQGGYRFNDYGRVGSVLTLLLFILIMALLPLVWSLR